jgi:hypothetical protein
VPAILQIKLGLTLNILNHIVSFIVEHIEPFEEYIVLAKQKMDQLAQEANENVGLLQEHNGAVQAFKKEKKRVVLLTKQIKQKETLKKSATREKYKDQVQEWNDELISLRTVEAIDEDIAQKLTDKPYLVHTTNDTINKLKLAKADYNTDAESPIPTCGKGSGTGVSRIRH